MYRGTTPTFTLTMPEGFSFDDSSNVYVTFTQGNYTLTKTGDGIVISGNTVDVYFDQAESLSFHAGSMNVQINITYPGGQRTCTEIAQIQIKGNLLPEVLE